MFTTHAIYTSLSVKSEVTPHGDQSAFYRTDTPGSQERLQDNIREEHGRDFPTPRTREKNPWKMQRKTSNIAGNMIHFSTVVFDLIYNTILMWKFADMEKL